MNSLNGEQLLIQNFENLLSQASKFRIKDMRAILTVLREHTDEATRSQIFLPKYNMTMGEFCVFYLIKIVFCRTNLDFYLSTRLT